MPACNTNLFLSRDVRVFLELIESGSGADIWEIPVLNGYSLGQTTNASTVTLAEMSNTSGTSRRGQRVFNDSLAPAEWSFDVYMRPTLDTNHFAVEEPLWACFVGKDNTFNSGTDAWSKGVTRDTGSLEFDFDDSNVSALTTFNLYFVLGARAAGGNNFADNDETTIYKISNCVVNEATINFEIDGIGMVSWSGFGSTITEVATFNASSAITTGISATSNMIRNRLTALRAVSNVDGTNTAVAISGISVSSGTATVSTADTTNLTNGDIVIIDGVSGDANGDFGGLFNGAHVIGNVTSDTSFTIAVDAADGSAVLSSDGATYVEGRSYSLTLTGGSITLSNNITFLTPETLGIVNVPLEHVTGTRSVSGNFTAYLDAGTDGTIDLYEDMLGATTVITNQFALDFYIGGKDTLDKPVAPGVQFKLNNCHLEIPSIQIEDVIGVDINFTALPRNLGCMDEVGVIRYIGV